MSRILRLGARGSMLSRMQSAGVARALEAAHPGLKVELVIVTTSGDRIQDKPLHAFGGKGLFTKELELALLEGRVDLAVHSFKDVPVTMPLVDVSGLVIAAVPKREDVRDVLVSAGGKSLRELPTGAKVGTGSLRRAAQVMALRNDVEVLGIRGNVDTRLKKMKAGEFDAVVLAMAGVKRAELWDERMMRAIEVEQMLPAAGQGALALQCRAEDVEAREILGAIHDADAAMCTELERAVVKRLEGDCHSPIGAWAQVRGEVVELQVMVAAREGRPPVLRAKADGRREQADAVLDGVMAKLEKQGARAILHGEGSSG